MANRIAAGGRCSGRPCSGRPRSGRPLSGHRRPTWALAAIALAVSLAGCVSMPDSGPPEPLQASPSSTTQDASNIEPIPAPPKQGLNPEQIVQAFLEVSASYSTYPEIVKSYLTPQKAGAWNPRWSATVFSAPPSVTQSPAVKGRSASKQVVVTALGKVQATFSGTGQYLSAAPTSTQSSCSSDEPDYTCEEFTLVQVGGQWRIAGLPSVLLLDEADFDRVYQTQDLYFFDSSYKNLVPDTVFVPKGTPAQQTLTTLVCTLIPAGGCKSGSPAGSSAISASQTWLTAGATVTSIPPGTTLLSPVTVTAGTATVNLGGGIADSSEQKSIPLVMAQLTWTLIGSPTGSSGSLPAITAVDLEINNNPLTSPQTTASYSKYAPYPPNEGVFTYVDNGVAQSRCGSSLANFAATGVPVFDATGIPALTTCGGASATPSPSPSGQRTSGKARTPGKAVANPVSMVVASPAANYLAGVSPGRDSVSVWNMTTQGVVFKWSWQGQTISSISWDQQDDLWVVVRNKSAQTSTIYMLSMTTGRETTATFPGSGTVLSLSVAPDGVRAALIVQSESGTQQQVELAGIERVACGATCRFPGSVAVTLAVGPPLGGPDITYATSLAWYDQDDLAVIDMNGPISYLWDVPVSGRSPNPPRQVSAPSGSTAASAASSPFAESIAADNTGSVLVVGMSDGQLLYSAGFGQPWQVLGTGSMPAYGAQVNP